MSIINDTTSSDTTKPTISNVKVSNITPDGYTVTCTVSDNKGVTRVLFPTWSEYAGSDGNSQDDITWGAGSISGSTATYNVKISDHSGNRGFYFTHIYAYDAAGNETSTSIGGLVLVPQAMATLGNSTYYLADMKHMNYTWAEARQKCASCVQQGHLASITSAEEQKTVAALLKKSSNSKTMYWIGATDEATEGSFYWENSESFSYKNWGPSDPNGGAKENYVAMQKSDGTWQDLPAKGSGGDVTRMGYVMEVENSDTQGPAISGVSISNITPNGYDITCKVSDRSGIDRVEFYNWSEYNDQDDMTHANGTAKGNTYTFHVKTSDHHGDRGYYSTHIYAYDKKGNNKGYPVNNIPVPQATTTYEGSTYYLMDMTYMNFTWTEAKEKCSKSRIGGHLATVTSAGEQKAVAELLKKSTNSKTMYWLGATDEKKESSYVWQTGEKFSYANWGPSDPNGGTKENYVAMVKADGTWQDLPATGSGGAPSRMGFILEVDGKDGFPKPDPEPTPTPTPDPDPEPTPDPVDPDPAPDPDEPADPDPDDSDDPDEPVDPDPDDPDDPAPAPDYTPRGYVARLYADILGNGSPSDAQLNYWADQISRGRPVASIVRGFCESDAFAGAGYSNEAKVRALYAAMLGNYEPTDYQLEYWVGKLNAGGGLYRSVVLGFSRSAAFEQQVSLYGLGAGELDAQDYVMRLYNDLLGIDQPSEYQLSYWAGVISSGTSAADVVAGFCSSEAWSDQALSPEQEATALYGAMLGNYEPTEYQVSFWASRLASGEPVSSVVAGMAASDAFAQQVALYGLGA